MGTIPVGKSYISFILEDQSAIIDFVGQISTEMYDYIDVYVVNNMEYFTSQYTQKGIRLIRLIVCGTKYKRI